MEHTNDIPLSLISPNIWRGQNKSNGQLMKLHEYSLAVGYAALVISPKLATELTAMDRNSIPFGNAAWYDDHIRTTMPNKVYGGIPVASGAVPKLAGVIAYDPALASMQPVNADGIMPYNKGKLIKRGFVHYKTGKAAVATFADDGTDAVLSYASIDPATMALFFEKATGDPVFAVPTGYGPDLSAATTVAQLAAAINAANLEGAWKPTLAGCVYAGKIIQLYPEDGSVLVALDI
jgi:hypothetical protein